MFSIMRYTIVERRYFSDTIAVDTVLQHCWTRRGAGEVLAMHVPASWNGVDNPVGRSAMVLRDNWNSTEEQVARW